MYQRENKFIYITKPPQRQQVLPAATNTCNVPLSSAFCCHFRVCVHYCVTPILNLPPFNAGPLHHAHLLDMQPGGYLASYFCDVHSRLNEYQNCIQAHAYPPSVVSRSELPFWLADWWSRVIFVLGDTEKLCLDENMIWTKARGITELQIFTATSL